MSDSSTVFDADALAIGPPKVRIDGHVHVGRVLSIVEWLGFRDRLLAMEEREQKDIAAQQRISVETAASGHALTIEYLRAVLAPRRFGLRRVDPVARLEAMGKAVLSEVFARFFVHQWRLTTGAPRRPPTDPATSGAPTSEAGMSSRDATTPVPSDDAGKP